MTNGVYFGTVPEWDTQNNPTMLASKHIKQQKKLEEAKKAGLTDTQIEFMRKYKII